MTTIVTPRSMRGPREKKQNDGGKRGFSGEKMCVEIFPVNITNDGTIKKYGVRQERRPPSATPHATRGALDGQRKENVGKLVPAKRKKVLDRKRESRNGKP